MDKYMGFELIDAKPMNLGEYNKFKGWTIPDNEDPNTEGYLIEYWNYSTWSPKNEFESAHILLKGNDKLVSNISIDKDLVEGFIKEVTVQKIGEKTTLVLATLINGYEIIETSSCADVANYNEEMGKEICLERIKNKIWELLGFLLQTAMKGVK